MPLHTIPKSESHKSKAHTQLSLVADSKAQDPALASLFAASVCSRLPFFRCAVADPLHQSGPVKPPPRSRYHALPPAKPCEAESDEDQSTDGELSADNEDGLEEEEEQADTDTGSEEEALSDNGQLPIRVAEALIDGSGPSKTRRKRKRNDDEDNLEGAYLQSLAREEVKAGGANQRATKRQKAGGDEAEDETSSGSEQASEDEDIGGVQIESADSDIGSPIPQHESLTTAKDPSDLEKASRTVFLGNVSTLAITSKSARKTLLSHLSSFFPSLPIATNASPHKIESFRFRSTAFATPIPKKAAFAKKELMETTTKSTNAYAVYSTPALAREAARRLNGTVVLDRHLRVDEVAHPAKVDHRRCVFVGNLGFVDDSSAIDAAKDVESGKKERKKARAPGDVEEGLWRTFGRAGQVESVRVVRDPKTRVGKGIAYVQFTVSSISTHKLSSLHRVRLLTLENRTRTAPKQHSSTTTKPSRLSSPASFASCAQRA